MELLAAVAEEGITEQVCRLLAYDEDESLPEYAREYLVMAGLAGLRRSASHGEEHFLPLLRRHASDPRWRVREAAALGLERWGRKDMAGLLAP